MDKFSKNSSAGRRLGLRVVAGAPDGAAGFGPGVLAVLDHEDAVDEHEADADGVLVGPLEGGAVGDGGGVERDDVGAEALAKQAAVADREAGGDGGGHLADRVLQ